MLLYRLCRRQFSELNGLGAKKTGGRWNRKGISALYTAQNASLAVVEVLVHLDRGELPDDFIMLEISVPELAIVAIEIDAESRLRSFFQNGYHDLEAGVIGFSVPSVIVPYDRVVVLYPEAADYMNLSVTRTSPFNFDSRLFSLPNKV